MRSVEKAAVTVAFFVSICGGLGAQSSASSLEFRALWVVRHSAVSPEEIDRALLFARAYNFNHVFLQVRGRGHAFYESELVNKSPLIPDQQFDPLRYAIRKGRLLGLNIHAWINVFLAWSSEERPEDQRHIVNQFPEWIDRSSLGETSSTAGIVNGQESGRLSFLSPSHPGVRNHLVKVVEEMLANYDLDGIHLDYIRYGDSDFGYNLTARLDFEREFGVDPLRLFTTDGSGYETVTSAERLFLLERWNTSRRNAVTSLVRRVGELVLERNPGCLFTAAVKPNPVVAKNRFFQEWDRWLIEGLVDYVVPMNYATDLRKFAADIDTIYEILPRKYWSGIVMGVAAYNQAALDARDKIKYARVTGLRGVALFSYDAHKSDLDFFSPIGDELAK